MLSKDDKYRKIFASNLNYYMQINGKTQTDLMKDLGLKTATISSWCNAQKLPRMDKIEMLSKYFGIHFTKLIEERTSEKRKLDPSTIPLLSEYKNSYMYSIDNYYIKDLFINDIISANSFGLLIKDNSMSPLLDKDDIAIIERNTTLVSGKIYLIINHNLPIIRRIVKIDNSFELQALNPYYPIEKVDNIDIIGKVIRIENQSAFK